MHKKELIQYLLEKQILVGPDFINNLPENFDAKEFIKLLEERFKNNPLVLNNDLYNITKDIQENFDINWSDFDNSRIGVEKGKTNQVYNRFLDIMNYKNSEEKKEVLGKSGQESSSETVQVQKPVETEKKVVQELEKKEIVSEQEKKEIVTEKKKIEPNPKKVSLSGIEPGRVEVIDSYDQEVGKKEVQDFVKHFKVRYEALKNILLARTELQSSISINRAKNRGQREKVSIIGMISEKNVTKNGNVMLTVEDPTDSIKVLISKNKAELLEQAQDFVLDEVIGISGNTGENIIFANSLYNPDIPLNHELKKSPDEAYLIFVSDIHFGLDLFLEEDFKKLILWLKGEYGTEQQREIAKKVKYMVVAGDVVEGVGIYPGQEEDLTLPDVRDQYKMAADFFKQIPEHVKIIICGGNHDAMRIAEPQPPFDKNIAPGFFEIPNMVNVSNPSFVNIHKSEGFPGFNILIYHGWSLPYYGDNVPSIRQKGGMDRCDLILKYLLQRRHLAPSHGSNLYLPDPDDDPLVIKKVPDFFVTGHIHRVVAGSYRNVTILNSSCWVTQSEDQARRGIVPNPSKIPIVNLKTREIKIMNFRSEEDEQ